MPDAGVISRSRRRFYLRPWNGIEADRSAEGDDGFECYGSVIVVSKTIAALPMIQTPARLPSSNSSSTST